VKEAEILDFGWWIEDDVEWWMMDGVLKIRGPRRVCFQEIMGCFNFGFWMMDWGGAAVAGNE